MSSPIRIHPLPQFTKVPLDEYEKPIRKALRPVYKQTREVLTDGFSAFIYGPEGSGKSSLLGAIHKELASAHWLVGWVSAIDFPDDFLEARTFVNEVNSYPIIILDDVGKEPKNTRSMFKKLIFESVSPGRIVLCSSNLTVGGDVEGCQLTEYYGASARSRILGGDCVIKLTGKDYRLED